MGKKRGKKPKYQQHRTRTHYYDSELDQESVIRRPSSSSEEDDDLQEHPEDETRSTDLPSKFSLYRESVQMPKGDISYLQKFFFMYVGSRVPLHLQEDFCGTVLPSGEVAMETTKAALDGGISVLEITMTTPDVFEVLQGLMKLTILNDLDVKSAVKAGAKFLMSPATVEEILDSIQESTEVLYIPGVMTPTEVKWSEKLMKFK